MNITEASVKEEKLTKKEKYLLKKQKKEKERLRKMQSKKIKEIFIISLPIFLIIGGVVFGIINYSPEKSHPGTPKIEINPSEYDAGTVSMVEGLVKYTYEIKNTGEGDLKIDRIWTSCMCTTARLRVEDKESGEFGMHTSSTFWSQKIAPGQTGFLEVTFDPAFHGPQGVGKIVRAVYLSTNDPQNQKAEVKLISDVVQ
jgi:hypothetical protein